MMFYSGGVNQGQLLYANFIWGVAFVGGEGGGGDTTAGGTINV